MSSNEEKYYKDELEPPAWLNVLFLKDIFQNYENSQDVEVKSFKISPGSQKGDHYASILFRASVDYMARGELLSKSIIIKMMPEVDGCKKELLSETHIFETEIGMYRDIIPKFEEVLHEAGDDAVLSAPCIYYTVSRKKLIVLADIVPSGFIVVRDRSLNLTEVRLAYKKLAKWHAVSLKMTKENPLFFKDYYHSMFTLPNIFENQFFAGGLEKFTNLLDKLPDLRQFKPYFEAQKVDYMQKCKASFQEYTENRKSDAYYVLNHGDFHGKNMMFKYNPSTGVAEDNVLLDFQISYFGPIPIDLIYSFYMILDKGLRANHKDELIYFYFETFLATLKQINYNGPQPRYTEFRRQLMDHKHYELYLVYTFLPFRYALEAGGDVSELMETEDARKYMYDNKDYIEELHALLPRYQHLGYFEY